MSTPALEIATVQTADQVVIAVSGELVFDNSRRLLDEASTILTSPPIRLVLDLEQIAFCDSTGVSCLIRIHTYRPPPPSLW